MPLSGVRPPCFRPRKAPELTDEERKAWAEALRVRFAKRTQDDDAVFSCCTGERTAYRQKYGLNLILRGDRGVEAKIGGIWAGVARGGSGDMPFPTVSVLDSTFALATRLAPSAVAGGISSRWNPSRG